MDVVRIPGESNAPHPTRFGYYGGPEDGRLSRMDCMTDVDFSWALWSSSQIDYICTRYAQHENDNTICWAIWTYGPIAEREGP